MSGKEELLKTRLRAIHGDVLARGTISIGDLQIERIQLYGNETPFATYYCNCLLNGQPHGVIKKRVSTLIQPGSLTCDLCQLLMRPNKFTSPTVLRDTLENLMRKKRPEMLNRVDLSDLHQMCLRRDNRTAIYISYICKRMSPDGKQHGEQRTIRSKALRLKFHCDQCSREDAGDDEEQDESACTTAANYSPNGGPTRPRPLFIDTTLADPVPAPISLTPVHKNLLTSPCSVTGPTPQGVSYDRVQTPRALRYYVEHACDRCDDATSFDCDSMEPFCEPVSWPVVPAEYDFLNCCLSPRNVMM